jgi:hypothetical protein
LKESVQTPSNRRHNGPTEQDTAIANSLRRVDSNASGDDSSGEHEERRVDVDDHDQP